MAITSGKLTLELDASVYDVIFKALADQRDQIAELKQQLTELLDAVKADKTLHVVRGGQATSSAAAMIELAKGGM